MGNASSRYDEEQMDDNQGTDKLSEWLVRLYREKVRFQRSPKEIDDIKDAVTEMIRKLIFEIGSIDKRFENCTDTLVGSVTEGSKIGEPDEFDFLIKVYALSLTPGVSIVRQCTGRPGYAHVVVDGKVNGRLAEEWSSMLMNGRLRSTEPAHKTGLRDRHAFLLGAAIRRLQERNSDVVSRMTGKLQIKASVKTYGPSCVCLSRWTPTQQFGGEAKALDVDIDTVLAIHATGYENVIDQREMPDQQIQETLKESQRFMVIPSGRASCEEGLCFRLTFTNSEIILYNQLRVHHRKCFKILKYLMKIIEPDKNEQSVLFSYALKAFVFNHDKGCSVKDDRAIGGCIKALLQEIAACLANKQASRDGNGVRIFLPGICLTTHNIFDKDLEELPLIKKERSIASMIKDLQDIEAGRENRNANHMLE